MVAFRYQYRCSCGYEVEDINMSPPICPDCQVIMKRVFTAPQLIVRGGTPNFHGFVHDKAEKTEQEEGIAEYEKEQKERRKGMRERKENDKKAFKAYCEGELHHKHGRPDEATTHDPCKKYEGLT
jgi:predicted nucleic acid-binding Zn ribbon protein